MNDDLFKWLRYDLGSQHLIESDLNDLIYHPTHGSRCRRCISFINATTLCCYKHPDVLANEDYDEATQELIQGQHNWKNLFDQVEQQARDNENDERKLSFLKSNLEHLKRIEDLQNTSREALQVMKERSNLEIEQIASNIRDCHYLTKSDFWALYATPVDLNKSEWSMISRRQAIAEVDLSSERDNLLRGIETMHIAISKTFSAVTAKLGTIDNNCLSPIKVAIDDLIALSRPKFETISICEPGAEEHLKLCNNVINLNTELKNLSDKYETECERLKTTRRRRLKNCIDQCHQLCGLERSYDV